MFMPCFYLLWLLFTSGFDVIKVDDDKDATNRERLGSHENYMRFNCG